MLPLRFTYMFMVYAIHHSFNFFFKILCVCLAFTQSKCEFFYYSFSFPIWNVISNFFFYIYILLQTTTEISYNGKLGNNSYIQQTHSCNPTYVVHENLKHIFYIMYQCFSLFVWFVCCFYFVCFFSSSFFSFSFIFVFYISCKCLLVTSRYHDYSVHVFDSDIWYMYTPYNIHMHNCIIIFRLR